VIYSQDKNDITNGTDSFNCEQTSLKNIIILTSDGEYSTLELLS